MKAISPWIWRIPSEYNIADYTTRVERLKALYEWFPFEFKSFCEFNCKDYIFDILKLKGKRFDLLKSISDKFVVEKSHDVNDIDDFLGV